ncbi:MAG TPA: hypothetical protein DCX22_01970 [Dehalococcoidia bacterium]|nr:hypothetical protein [Dehalococcoidia bacterium]
MRKLQKGKFTSDRELIECILVDSGCTDRQVEGVIGLRDAAIAFMDTNIKMDRKMSSDPIDPEGLESSLLGFVDGFVAGSRNAHGLPLQFPCITPRTAGHE